MTTDPTNTSSRLEGSPSPGADEISATGGPRRDQSTRMKREFILAMGIFVAMAVVGTIFGLWYAFTFAPVRP